MNAGRLRGAIAARLRRPDPAVEIDRVAVVAEQLSVLMSAGVSAASGWGHVAAGGGDAVIARAAAAAAREGEPVDAAILDACDLGGAADRHRDRGRDDAWATLAAAWSVAAASGAPLAANLRDLAAALRDEAQLRREVRAALAGPRSSARMVMALPLVAVGFGALLGFDTAGVLFGNPLGLACLGIGLLLLWAGYRWNRALAARAAPDHAAAGLELDLLAIAMSGGVSVPRARALVDAALDAGAIARGRAAEVDGVIALAAAAGAPLAELLRAEAFRLRRAARADGAARAAALGVRLMLPLGACVLPAFVVLGVAPLVISVVTGTFGSAA